MLEKPDLPDGRLIEALRREFGLSIASLAFLPLGADRNTAVYRAVADDGTPYFVKLRSGPFEEATIVVPYLLWQQGVRQLIAPLATRSGALWGRLDGWAVIVSPFVDGKDGYERRLVDHHWGELGATLRALHTMALPSELRQRLPREEYSAEFRQQVRSFQRMAERESFADPVAVQVAALLVEQATVIDALLDDTERLADELRRRALPEVVCHADLHAFNVLIDDDGKLFVVDWDTLTLAPKERDLMFIGGGIGGIWDAPAEATLFYQGYGQAEVDRQAIAYFRYERIIQDIAAYCDALLLTDEGGADREQSFRFLASNFTADGLLEFTRRTDPTRR